MEKVAHNPPVFTPGCESPLLITETSSPVVIRPVQSEIMASPIMQLARKFNCFFIDRVRIASCKPFIVDGFQIGLITPEVLDKLKTYPSVFRFTDKNVQLAPHLKDYESRSKAVDRVLREFKNKETFITLKGWRDECFEVRVDEHTISLMKMERAATCLFGIRQFGVDINGYVKHPTLGLCLWLQRRSLTKQRWPGKWDNIVGGGLSVGFTVLETAHKEAGEEASIPENILQNLQRVGHVSIFFESERGLSPNTEFVFDLELPLDFIPKNQDGEVSEFHLYPVTDALKIILSPDFKTTSCPVALDFLIRHGVVNAENEPDLEDLKQLLHIPLTDFYRKIDPEAAGDA